MVELIEPDAEPELELEPVEPPVLPDAQERENVDFGNETFDDEEEAVCAAQSSASELRRVHLSFIFDVSGSMGDEQDRFELKWQPVVAAAKAFFAEPDAAALSASMTFFPINDNRLRCNPTSYVEPDVPQTLLPSVAFAEAIDALGRAPNRPGWGNSTPTLAAFQGVAHGVALHAAETPGELQSIVLVTDGVPENCADDENDVQVVANAVLASGVTTYVVGVSNLPDDNNANNLGNLHLIAEAGGTGQAFIIETGDPAQTQAELKRVIDGIRGVSISCNIEIPLPPAGSEFVPERVNLTYTSESNNYELAYSADCSGADTWRYDDPAAPTSIQLCDVTCDTVRRDVRASLMVEFGCARRDRPR